ncbi:MAG: glycosyltransferase family 2 protein, partial [Planktomarina sp.]
SAAQSDVTMIVVDNASRQDDFDAVSQIASEYDWVHVVRNEDNIGYFPGLNTGIAYLEDQKIPADVVMIGNNDMLVDADFITNIETHQDVLAEHYVVCPNIISAEGHAQNPHVVTGFSTLRWIVWRVHYSSFFASKMILSVARALGSVGRRRDTQDHQAAGFIATGYGACYFLGPKYLTKGRRLFMPTFLMQEEYFLSHQLKELGQKPYYFPGITLHHVEHATVKSVPKRIMWDYERASYKMMRKLEQKAKIFS